MEGICPLYSEENKKCKLKREWGVCTEKPKDQYTYYWKECGWYLQENPRRVMSTYRRKK